MAHARCIAIPSDAAQASSLFEILGTKIRLGKLVAFPTETVYGLGANTLNREALLELFATKQRPLSDPLISHVPSVDAAVEQLLDLTDDEEFVFRLLAKIFWPGPLSIIGKANTSVPSEATASSGYVAVRCPSNRYAIELMKAARVPISAPSANKFGHISPTTAQHVLKEFFDYDLDIVEGGDCQIGLESTVIRPEIFESSVTTLHGSSNDVGAYCSLPSISLSVCILRVGQITKKSIEKSLLAVLNGQPIITKSGRRICLQSVYYAEHLAKFYRSESIENSSVQAFDDDEERNLQDSPMCSPSVSTPPYILPPSPPLLTKCLHEMQASQSSGNDSVPLDSSSPRKIYNNITPSNAFIPELTLGKVIQAENECLLHASLATNNSDDTVVLQPSIVPTLSPGMLLTHYAPNLPTFFIFPPEFATQNKLQSKILENSSHNNEPNSLSPIKEKESFRNPPFRYAIHRSNPSFPVQHHLKMFLQHSDPRRQVDEPFQNIWNENAYCRSDECILIDVGNSYKHIQGSFLSYFSLCDNCNYEGFESAGKRLFKVLHLAEERGGELSAKAILLVAFQLHKSCDVSLAVFDRLYRSASGEFADFRQED